MYNGIVKIPDEPVMYILVNNDLGMKKGKIASQVGHVVQNITEDIIRMGYENSSLQFECP